MNIDSLELALDFLKCRGIRRFDSIVLDKDWTLIRGEGFELAIPGDNNDMGRSRFTQTSEKINALETHQVVRPG